MRTRLGFLALSFLVGAACYQRPPVPRDKPLPCEDGDAAGECPSSMVCVAKVCASTSCTTDEDCPVSLVCARASCGLPGSQSDAGGPFSDGGIQIAPGFDSGITIPSLDGAAPGTNPPIGGGGDAGSSLPSFDGGAP